MKKKIKESLFFKSLILLKQKPKNLLFIFLFDILFFVLITLIGFLFFSGFPKTETALRTMANEIGLLPIFLLLILYYLVILFVHSTIKLFIINQISKIDKKIWKFFLSNVITFFLLIIISSISMLIIYNVLDFIFKEEIVRILVIVLVIFYISLNYTFISISQFLATKKLRINQILKKTSNLTFKRFLFPPTILAILVAIAYLFRNIPQIQLSAIILAFLFILINRAYFYLLSKNVHT